MRRIDRNFLRMWIKALVAALLVFAGSDVARAQPAVRPRPDRTGTVAGDDLGLQTGPTLPPPLKVDPPVLASKWLARVAMIELKALGVPRPRDYQIAVPLLELAHRIQPKDQNTLRLLIEASEQAGDEASVLALTRELFKLDRSDTVSELRLVTASVGRLQNADARLAAYDRFLGPDGNELDESVRSRLALDAALLLRERGDDRGCADRLASAVALDPTNRDAAVMALTFFSEHVPGDVVGRCDLLFAVLYADPMEVETHRSIAREMAQAGAFEGAFRFFQNVQTIYAQIGVDPSAQDLIEGEVVQLMVNGPEPSISSYTGQLYSARVSALTAIKEAEAKRQPTDQLPQPEDLRLPVYQERVRLVAAMGNQGLRLIPAEISDQSPALWPTRFIALLRIEGCMIEFLETMRRTFDRVADPKNWSEVYTEAQAKKDMATIREELAWMRLWSGYEVDEAATVIDSLRAENLLDETSAGRLSGWLHLRRGELDQAEGVLQPLASTDPLAELGLAGVDEARGQKARAAERYRAISSRISGTPAGAFAAIRYSALTGKPPTRTELAIKLEDAARGIPRWIDDAIRDPIRIQSLQVRPDKTTFDVLEPISVRVSLRNISPVALAVGPKHPINSRVLLAPRLKVFAEDIPTAGMLEVLSLQRRLRLPAQRSIEAVVDADAGQLGMSIARFNSQPIRIWWRAIQGFRLQSEDYYDAGPGSVASAFGPVTQNLSAFARSDLPTIRAAFTRGTPAHVVDATNVLVARVFGLGAVPCESKDAEPLFRALAERFPTLDREFKLLILCLLPPEVVMPALKAVDAVASTDPDPDVLLTVLASRIGQSDHPLLAENAPLLADKPALRRLAAMVKARLESGAITRPNVIERPSAPAIPSPSSTTPGSPDPSGPLPGAP